MALRTVSGKQALVADPQELRVLFEVKEGPATHCASCGSLLPAGSFVTRGLPGDCWAVVCQKCRPFEIVNEDPAPSAEPEAVTWGLVELMGHNRVAGRITEETRFGTTWLRVDVPGIEGVPGFTQLYGSGAIYRITFTTEQVARAAAMHLRTKPPLVLLGMGEPPALQQPPADTGFYDDEYVDPDDDDDPGHGDYGPAWG